MHDNLKHYLDNCCLNRPFDDQIQQRIYLETEAKLIRFMLQYPMHIPKTMHAAVLSSYRKFSWTEVPVPEIRDNQVLLKVAYAGICGSDLHVFNGDFKPRTPVPFIPGHEFAGTVAATGSKVTGIGVGERAAVDPIMWCGVCAACEVRHYPACTGLKLLGIDTDGGFAEYAACDETMLHKIPGNVSDQNAALVEVLSIGFHACARSGVKKGDTAAILGMGRVGQCILQALRTITDETIFAVELHENRLAIARDNFKNVIAINAVKENPLEIIKKITNSRGVDVSFEAVGHAADIPGAPDPVCACVRAIRGAGTVCVLGLGDEPSPLVMKELIWKEAKIIASRVSHGEFPKAIAHLSAGNLKPEVLVTDILPADQIQQAFGLLENEPSEHLKILLINK